MKKKITAESALKKAAVQLLRIHRIYNFPVVAAMGSPPGLPDRIAIKDGVFIGIEFKAAGRKLTDYQEDVKHQIEAAGGIYLVVRELEDLQRGLNLPGLFI